MALLDWLEQHLLACPMKYFFGADCPGCGMQRSLIELMKGNIAESFRLYPALFPVLITLVLLFVHLKYKLNRGAQFIQYSFGFSVLVIVTSFVIKQIQLFNQ
jgi:hypothetical protein